MKYVGAPLSHILLSVKLVTSVCVCVSLFRLVCNPSEVPPRRDMFLPGCMGLFRGWFPRKRSQGGPPNKTKRKQFG